MNDDCDSFLGPHDSLLFPSLDEHDAENIRYADFTSDIFRDDERLPRVDVHAALDPEDAALDESDQYLVNGDDDVNWLDSPTRADSSERPLGQLPGRASEDKPPSPKIPPAPVFNIPPALAPTSIPPYLNGSSPMYYSPLPLPFNGPPPTNGSLPLFGHLPHPVGGNTITPQMAAQMSAQVQQQMMPYSYSLPGPLPLPMQGQMPGSAPFEPFRPRGGRFQHRGGGGGGQYGSATMSRRFTPIAPNPNPHPLRPTTPEEQSATSSPAGEVAAGVDAGGDGLPDLPPSSRFPPRHPQMHRSMSSHALGQLAPLLPLPCFPSPIPIPGMLPPLPRGMRRVHSTGDLQVHGGEVTQGPYGVQVYRDHGLTYCQGGGFGTQMMAHPGGGVGVGMGMHPFEERLRVGRYSMDERKQRIERYRMKRNERNYAKKIKYACRKTLADSRPRVRGRFARNDDLGDEMDYDLIAEDEEGELDENYSDMLDRVLGGELSLLQTNGSLYKVKREPM